MSAVALTSINTLSSTENRVLELLSTGIEQVAVASALGLSESRLSQIIADPIFSAALAEAKYKQLAKHNETDNLYDKIERKLADKLEKTVDMMFKPTEIARTLTMVNGLKRRGASNPDSIVRAKPVVRLNIPIAVVNKFAMNAAGQVITAEADGNAQDLVTMQSGNLKGLLSEHAKLMGSELGSASTSNRRLIEADGVRYIKPQGRESHDILAECGFTVEVESTIQPSDNGSSHTSSN